MFERRTKWEVTRSSRRRACIFVVAAAAGWSAVACDKADSGSPSPSPGVAASQGATPTATSTAPVAAPVPAKAAFVQKGIAPGKVVVGYLQDSTDPNQCAAVIDLASKKDDFTKNGDQFAQMMKSKVVAACPTDDVVGTCNAGMGLLVNYSGPKWTADTAKKDCLAHPHQKWVD
jgi:hypothetical protein